MEFFWSEELLDEILRVIARPKFEKYGASGPWIEAIRRLAADGTVVPLGEIIARCRDSKDDHVLQLSQVGEVSFLVTGDADLLTLDPFEGTRIVSPATFTALPQW